MKKFFFDNRINLLFFFISLICLVSVLGFENISFANMRLEWFEITYCGIMSTGVAYTIQIVAQGKANPAPAAIILSMESVFAAIAGWIIMNQYLDSYKLVGCLCVLLGVILVQLIPLYVNRQKNL